MRLKNATDLERLNEHGSDGPREEIVTLRIYGGDRHPGEQLRERMVDLERSVQDRLEFLALEQGGVEVEKCAVQQMVSADEVAQTKNRGQKPPKAATVVPKTSRQKASTAASSKAALVKGALASSFG